MHQTTPATSTAANTLRHQARRAIAAATAAALLAGCATSSKDVTTSYISPVTYQAYDCEQLSAEITRVQHRSQQLSGRLDEAANNDKVIMGVGMLLFWPALFALGGTKQQEADYARLKGEHDALSQTAIQRKCPGAVDATDAVRTVGTKTEPPSAGPAAPADTRPQ